MSSDIRKTAQETLTAQEARKMALNAFTISPESPRCSRTTYPFFVVFRTRCFVSFTWPSLTALYRVPKQFHPILATSQQITTSSDCYKMPTFRKHTLSGTKVFRDEAAKRELCQTCF